ncbi:hypothetical protein NEOLEDRAFT_56417 [Neolentinus lepideus HHB14362 ss-1]|uniref:Uncharacterized protein n=1 Tax=Neolentinus lepideus HHB14362 ss-1 TaxID=1314782 RepID=A0A165U744_9AGAM|nr:hypothetical protein NEOLEDRAFT_56417 [Neolentinus lepideus HHB14362 ss-1]
MTSELRLNLDTTIGAILVGCIVATCNVYVVRRVAVSVAGLFQSRYVPLGAELGLVTTVPVTQPCLYFNVQSRPSWLAWHRLRGINTAQAVTFVRSGYQDGPVFMALAHSDVAR